MKLLIKGAKAFCLLILAVSFWQCEEDDEGNALPEVIAAFDDGSVIGPRVYKAGFIDGVSPYSAPTGKLAEDLDDALKMIREYAEAGYPQIKIYSSIYPCQ